MNARILVTASVLLVANVVFAQDKSYPKAKVRFDAEPGIVADSHVCISALR